MKTRNIVLASLIMLILPGCFVKSLHPFYREKETILKKELFGVWEGNDSTTWKIEQEQTSAGLFKPATPAGSYLVTYTDKNGTSRFSAHLFQVGKRLFLDFYPEDVESTTDMMASHLVPMHTVARVDLSGNQLTIRWYNEEWLTGLFKQNKIRISHEKIPVEHGKSGKDDFQVVLTASTEDLQKFMVKYADDPKAFSNDFTFVLRKKITL